MRYEHNWKNERRILTDSKERGFDRLKRKRKRGWYFDMLEKVKKWKRKSWGGVNGLGYVDIECKRIESESESLSSNILEKERDDEILT